MTRRRQPPSQGWKTFRRNHADGMAAAKLITTPMRRICSSCCARAASGHAAALPSSVMNSRRFITRSPVRRGRAGSVVRREGFAERHVMEYQADSSGSLQFDPRKLDHLGPFLSIRGYEFSELAGRLQPDHWAWCPQAGPQQEQM